MHLLLLARDSVAYPVGAPIVFLLFFLSLGVLVALTYLVLTVRERRQKRRLP